MKGACVYCDFCGKSEHQREIIVRGPRADICEDCAKVVLTYLPPISDEEIDAIADAMPGGMDGFLKGWGWRQFAREVLRKQLGEAVETESAATTMAAEGTCGTSDGQMKKSPPLKNESGE